MEDISNLIYRYLIMIVYFVCEFVIYILIGFDSFNHLIYSDAFLKDISILNRYPVYNVLKSR